MNLWGIIKGLVVSAETDRSKQLTLEIDPAATTATKTILKSAQTANRTLTLPDATDTLMGKATVDVVSNKSIDADTNTITNIDNNEIKALAAIDATKLADGSVSNTELQFINSVTSNVQDQLNAGVVALTAHINDTTDAHDASAISVVPTGQIFSTDVQGAFNELDFITSDLRVDLDNHISDTTGAHTASAITNVPSGNLVATDVQGALNEIQTQVDSIIASGGVTTASNVGAGAGQVFKQRTLDDLEFRTLSAGTNISVTNNTNDITIAASGLANETLSNLSNPTSINQDLTFNGAHNILIAQASATNPGQSINVLGGASGTGTDLSGGQVTIAGGSSTGNGGSAINFALPISQQGSGTTSRSSLQIATFTSASNDNRFTVMNPSTQAAGMFFQVTNTNSRLRTPDSSSASAPPLLWVLPGGNSSTGNTGSVQIDTLAPTAAAANSGGLSCTTGNTVNGTTGPISFATGSGSAGTGASGSINLSTGATAAGNSGNIQITTGNPSTTGTRGTVNVSANAFNLAQTPLTMSQGFVGITTTEPQLLTSGHGIINVTTTGASTIQGISAGQEGQMLIIRNASANNLSFANENASAVAADRITTQTGATITSAGISMHMLIYLQGRWQYLSGQL